MRRRVLSLARAALIGLFGLALGLGLVVGGLVVAPTYDLAEPVLAEPARRPPIVPPSVPEGAPEEWAIWTYFEKLGQVWERDWPLAIRWLEELNARYPGNPYTIDKLYAAYVEDAKERARLGDESGARRRLQQASALDPDRGVADELLDALDTSP